MVQRVKSFKPEALILHCPVSQIKKIINHFQQKKFCCPLFFPWIPGLKENLLHTSFNATIVCIQPYAEDNTLSQYHSFVKAFQDEYGEYPDPCAAYSYDAVNILISCIKSSGLNRVKLRDKIADLEGYKGVTGKISWDNGGGNTSKPVILSTFDTPEGQPTLGGQTSQ